MTALTYKRRHGLTTPQQHAVDLLTLGANDTAVAERLNLARETVTRWRLYDPLFRAYLHAKRAEVWGASIDGLRGTLPIAIDSVREHLRIAPNRGRLALDLLTRAGLMGKPHSGLLGQPDGPLGVGPTSVEGVLDAEVRRARARVAAECGEDDSPLGPVNAPVTDEERDAAYTYLTALAEQSNDSPESAAAASEQSFLDQLRAAHK